MNIYCKLFVLYLVLSFRQEVNDKVFIVDQKNVSLAFTIAAMLRQWMMGTGKTLAVNASMNGR